MFRWFLAMLSAALACMPLRADEDPHKIIFMLSTPRSLSTVFLRMMESRGDLAIYNEPTVSVYDIAYLPERTKGWFRQDAYTTFDDVKSHLYQSKDSGNVFTKNINFHAYNYLLSDLDFMRDSSIFFVLLVRNPHHALISIYRRINFIPSELDDVMSMKKLYAVYEAIKCNNPNGVKIIFSQQLHEQPRIVMQAYCNHVQLPFLEEMFVWKSHREDFTGHELWNEQKVGDHIHLWHGRAISSTEIGQPHDYEVDAEGRPTFSEVENDNDRAELIRMYNDNMLYYRKFLEAQEDHLITHPQN